MAKIIQVFGGSTTPKQVAIADDDLLSADGGSVVNRNGDTILEAPAGQRFSIDGDLSHAPSAGQNEPATEKVCAAPDPDSPDKPISETPTVAAQSGAGVRLQPVLSRRQIFLIQVAAAVAFVTAVGGLSVNRALNPNPYGRQAVADLTYHPIASIIGALAPSVVLSPLAFWTFGFIVRRHASRLKLCEHCGSSIKANVRVCRYCARDVAI